MLSNQLKKIQQHEAIDSQDLHGRIRIAYFDVDFTGAVAENVNIDVTKLPAGNVRILKVGFVEGNSGSSFDVGLRENVDFDGNVIPENLQAIAQALSEGKEKILNCRVLAQHMSTVSITNSNAITAGKSVCGYISYIVD